MRWGDRETSVFVNLYLKNDVLWNPNNIDYKSRAKRELVIKNIIEGFHAATGRTLSALEVKVKIKNLRSTYCQELGKIRQRSGGGLQYIPSLKWFKQWHTRFQNVTDSVYEMSEFNEPEEDVSLNADSENISDPFASHSDDGYVYLKPDPEDDANADDNDLDHVPHKIKKIKVAPQSPDVDTTARIPRLSYEELSTFKEDEFDVYGKYIAIQLRNMDLDKALKVQLEIQNIMSRARLSKD